MSDVRMALARGRAACLEHMAHCEATELPWTEEPVTEILLSRTAPEVRFAHFTHKQEAQVGADWLWWWLSSTGEAYGMLVQAKRLFVDGSRWHFNFGHNAGEQRRALFRAAHALDVAPIYMLYLGTQGYRGGAECGADSHLASHCPGCAALAVSLMPADLAVSHLVADAESTYERSVALETAVDNAETQPAWLGAIDSDLTEELRAFLCTPQQSVRAIARSLVDRVLHVRQGQFSMNTEALVHSEHLGGVFPELPGDVGHFSAPYLPTMLRGLLHAPPDYVLSMVAGEPLGEAPLSNIAGVVLLSADHHADGKHATANGEPQEA